MSEIFVKSLVGNITYRNESGNHGLLKVGDSLKPGDILIGDSQDNVVLLSNDKELKVVLNQPMVLDNDILQNSQILNADVSDVAAIQQSILSGQGLDDLEATAAGGGAPGAGGGISLGAAAFAQGGSESNVNANFNDLPNNFANVFNGVNNSIAAPIANAQPNVIATATNVVANVPAANTTIASNNEEIVEPIKPTDIKTPVNIGINSGFDVGVYAYSFKYAYEAFNTNKKAPTNMERFIDTIGAPHVHFLAKSASFKVDSINPTDKWSSVYSKITEDNSDNFRQGTTGPNDRIHNTRASTYSDILVKFSGYADISTSDGNGINKLFISGDMTQNRYMVAVVKVDGNEVYRFNTGTGNEHSKEQEQLQKNPEAENGILKGHEFNVNTLSDGIHHFEILFAADNQKGQAYEFKNEAKNIAKIDVNFGIVSSSGERIVFGDKSENGDHTNLYTDNNKLKEFLKEHTTDNGKTSHLEKSEDGNYSLITPVESSKPQEQPNVETVDANIDSNTQDSHTATELEPSLASRPRSTRSLPDIDEVLKDGNSLFDDKHSDNSTDGKSDLANVFVDKSLISLDENNSSHI